MAQMVKVQVAGGAERVFAQEEMNAFAEHINYTLKDNPRVQYLLPIKTGGLDLCAKVQDGVLLCSFINKAVPGTIDERAVNFRRKDNKELSLFQRNENNHLMINSAKGIGVKTINVGPDDLNEGEQHPHIVLGVVWQLVKIHLLNSINLKQHPELVRLLEDGESLEDLLRLPAEQLLLRWFNFHLRNSGDSKRVSNFSGDVKDSYAYTLLLNQIAPNSCSRDALREENLVTRAEMAISGAEKLGVQAFVKATDIAKGNPRLNLAFTAAIFNQCPGLDPLEEEELNRIGLDDEDEEGDREERAFRMWINSLGLEDVFLENLFSDCSDGLVLLKVLDVIQPGLVDWRRVEKRPGNKFKKVHNCNYAVLKGKELRFSLVNIAGSDIHDRNKTLVLALVWQMMRAHTLRFLAQVQRQKFGGKDVSDQDIIDWANNKVRSAGQSDVQMRSFKDKSLGNGVFFLELLRAVESRVIDDEFVSKGENPEDALLNARYAISVTRKLGGVIFLLPEDIVEVKPKMILTFVASIMSVSKE